MRRLILDSSVVVSAFRSRSGASNQLLLLADRNLIVPLVTPALFLEYEAVLKRPEQRLASGMTMADIDRALFALAALSEVVTIWFSWRPQLRDANDEMVLEAAVNGRADALVTYNVADFAEAAPRLGVVVMRPKEVLERIVR